MTILLFDLSQGTESTKLTLFETALDSALPLTLEVHPSSNVWTTSRIRPDINRRYIVAWRGITRFIQRSIIIILLHWAQLAVQQEANSVKPALDKVRGSHPREVYVPYLGFEVDFNPRYPTGLLETESRPSSFWTLVFCGVCGGCYHVHVQRTAPMWRRCAKRQASATSASQYLKPSRNFYPKALFRNFFFKLEHSMIFISGYRKPWLNT